MHTPSNGSFLAWLRTQVDRTDAVGEMARRRRHGLPRGPHAILNTAYGEWLNQLSDADQQAVALGSRLLAWLDEPKTLRALYRRAGRVARGPRSMNFTRDLTSTGVVVHVAHSDTDPDVEDVSDVFISAIVALVQYGYCQVSRGRRGALRLSRSGLRPEDVAAIAIAVEEGTLPLRPECCRYCKGSTRLRLVWNCSTNRVGWICGSCDA